MISRSDTANRLDSHYEIVGVRSHALGSVGLRPLWLGISLADTLLPPESVLDPRRIAPFDANETPFDRLIVGSAGRANVYDKALSS